MNFKEINLSKNIEKALEDIGYVEMTPIQEKSIPQIMEGRDLIGQSKTGTGKTASFGLPVVESIDSKNKNVQALVLCPTRELAVQVMEEIRKYLKYSENIKITAIYGGQSIERQIRDIKSGTQIIIGTPGRVMDHMRRKTLKLKDVKMVILDEADEMLNMGFEEDIETILKEVPDNRQTVLFSATMNKRILNITKKYLINPVNVKIKDKELTVNNIEQISIEMKQGMKDETVSRLIDIHDPRKAIVFCNTKKKVDNLIEILKSKGYKAEALHGDIKQEQRNRIMKRFKQGEIKILVATDVAARGIDVDSLDLVVNYDIPQEEEYYVHRIGRTGRNGNEGRAVTFFVGREKNKINSIQKYTNSTMKKGKIPTITEVNNIRNVKALSRIQEVIDEAEMKNEDMFNALLKQNDNDIEKIARALFSMITTKRMTKKESKANVSADENGNIKLFLSLGKKDNIKAKDVVGSIASNTAISGDEIGHIKILDNFSFVEIPADMVEDVMKSMEGKKIKGKEVNIEIAKN